ncbi:sulfurtransferase [Cohaesibacter celericrescens]|uniref:Sulfurtransferase n=1 Tax=Cohaesibacter celericrescens TaxID=2067669 RepID=A0A2N5XMS6_9HYPH|nr:rhodanese-like domain-containing protein [Cohaesibacter celericrescens]PLW75784.1 sulfurtransferase [Cohaesibacter celericrescens]
MKQLVTLAALAFAWLAAPAFADKLGPLVSPQALEAIEAASKPLIIDIRGNNDKGESLFEAGHIAGAVNAPYGLFRGPSDNPGQLISADSLQKVLRDIGADKDRPTVVAYQGKDISDFGAAARVYWTLKSAGFTDLSLLNGGIDNWKLAGLPLESGKAVLTPSSIEVTFSDQWLATTDDVLKIVNGDQKARLIDARPEDFWNGEKKHPAAARPGTLPQSEYFVHSSWFDNKPVIADAAKVKKLAAAGGFKNGEALVSFCNTGHWAATNWFALSELAELDNVKLYPESMVGYSNAGHEMANTPGLFKTLIKQVTGS